MTHRSSSSAYALTSAWRQDIHKQTRRFAALDQEDDLASAGKIAYLAAAATYRSGRGPWEHYARRSVANAIKSAARAEARHMAGRVDIGEAVLAPAAPDSEATVVASLDAARHMRRLAAVIRTWPLADRVLLALLYDEGLSQRQAAARLGVSQPRISQRHAQLLKALRAAVGLAA